MKFYRLNLRNEWILYAATVSFCLMAYWLPIYPDEVAYRILVGRYFSSGGFKTSLLPYCIEGFEVAPAHFLKFAAIFWGKISNFPSAAYYRLLPMSLLFLTLVSMHSELVKKKKNELNYYLFLFLLGTSGYSMVVFRPEIFIVFCIAMFWFFGLRIFKNKYDLINIALGATIVSSLFILISYMHAKALYLILPLEVILLYALYFSKANKYFFSYVIILIFLGLTNFLDALKMHQLGFLSCNQFPQVQEIMSNQGVNFLDIFNNPSHFLKNLHTSNDWVRYKRVFSQLSFRSSYDISYLPSMKESRKLLWPINFLIVAVVVYTFSCVLATNLRNWLLCLIKRKKITCDFILYNSLIVVFSCQFFLNIPKNWYDISLSLFTLGMLAFIAENFYQNELSFSSKKTVVMKKIINKAILIGVVMSLFVNYFLVYKPFKNGYLGPGISMKLPISYLKEIAQVNFKKDLLTSEPIVIDDTTYHMFSDNRKIFPVTYLMLFSESNPQIINASNNNKPMVAITACKIYESFQSSKVKKLLSKYEINHEGYSADICRWIIF